MTLFNKLKQKGIYLLSLVSLLGGTLLTPLTAYAANESPKDWPKWTQMDTSQPWNTSKGWGPPINPGCYVTSAAIQGARSGITKTSGDKDWNPLNINGGSAMGQWSYNGGKYTFKLKDHTDGFGNLTGAPAMGKDKAKKTILAYQKKGEFPIIHIDSGSGYKDGTHYAAVRKLSGDSLSMYDPARDKTYNTTDALKKSGKNWLTAAAWIEGWGGGPKDFNQAPAPAAGSADSSAKGGSSSKNSKSSGSSQAPKIKPIFNPFTTPTANNTTIGYDTEEKNGATDRGSRLAFYEYLGPKLVSWLQVVAIAGMLILLGWIIIIALFMLADYQTGGLIGEHINDKYRKILMPYNSGNNLYGTVVVKKTFISLFLTVFICGLILTDTLPLILGQFFFWISQLSQLI